MSIREYAAHRLARGLPGGSKHSVQKALAAGRISRTEKKKIDPEVADGEWAANSAPRLHRDHNAPAPRAALKSDLAPPPASRRRPPRAPTNNDADEALEPTPDYARSRAIREDYNARIARLEYEEAAGNLVARGAVGREQFRLARDTRNNVLAVPSRLDATLAAETDPAEVRRILTEDLIRALDGVAGE